MKSCIICYAQIYANSHDGLSKPDEYISNGHYISGESSELLKRFFELVDRQLEDTTKNKKDNGQHMKLIAEMVDSGMTACGGCSKIVESYCDLYHQLKSIELKLNWRLGMLKNIISSAQEVPGRMQNFRELFTHKQQELQGEAWDNDNDDDLMPKLKIDLFLNYKKELFAKCSRQLSESLPKLMVFKVRPSQDKKVLPNSPETSKVEDNEDGSDYENDNAFGPTEFSDEMKPIVQPDRLERVVDPLTVAANIKNAVDKIHEAENGDVATRLGIAVIKNEHNEDDAVSEMDYMDDFNERAEGLDDPSSSATKFKGSNLKTGTNTEYDGDIQVELPESGENTKSSPGLTPVFLPNAETGMLDCILYSQQFESKRDCQLDAKSAHDCARFKCEICGKGYHRRNARDKHFQEVHRGVRFKCRECSASFAQRNNLLTHLKTKCGKPKLEKLRKHQCEQCRKAFLSSSDLLRHVKGVHLGVRDFVCDVCGNEYLRAKSLLDHVDNVHNHLNCGKQKSRNNQCEQCGKAFLSAYDLRRHVSGVHLGIRDFVCDICGKGYFRSRDLRKHVDNVHNKKHNGDDSDSESDSEMDYMDDFNEGAEGLHNPSPPATKLKQGNLKTETTKQREGCAAKLETTDSLNPDRLRKHLISEGMKEDQETSQGNEKLPFPNVEKKDAYDDEDPSLLGLKMTQNELGSDDDYVNDNNDDGSDSMEYSDLDSKERNKSLGRGSVKEREYDGDIQVELPQSAENSKSSPGLTPVFLPSAELGKLDCILCSQQFESKEDCQLHAKSAHNGAIFRCGVCGKGYHSRSAGKRHLQAVHCGIRFKCRKCSVSFSQRNNLVRHLQTECGKQNSRKHQCEQCGKAFLSQYDLRRHVSGVHLGIRDFVCDICGKGYSRAKTLQEHVDNVHNKEHNGDDSDSESEYSAVESRDNCISSRTRSGQGKEYDGDIEVEEPESLKNCNLRKHQCEQCGKAYLSSSHLLRHVKETHLGVRDCICDVCGKGFLRPDKLRRHVKDVHQGSKKK